MFETEKDAIWYLSETTCLLAILNEEVRAKCSEEVKVLSLSFFWRDSHMYCIR